jgi:hypothetical protein
VGERGWSPEEYAERSVRSILAEILSPVPAMSGIDSGYHHAIERGIASPADRTGGPSR